MLPADLDPRELLALGRAVRELRVLSGFISQETLGHRCDLHRNYVGAIERGEINPTFRVLLKLERGLRVPLTHLIYTYERQRRALSTTAPAVRPTAATKPPVHHPRGATGPAQRAGALRPPRRPVR
jgi:transcriptional regulator with XRE-family HTH domain